MTFRRCATACAALVFAATGITPASAYPRPGRTELVSVASTGEQGNSHSQFRLSVSGDGRFVAFASFASNLVPGDTNGTWDVFVHDREKGTTERVSVASDGSEVNEISSAPSMSDDGRYVAFQSNSPDLVPGDTNGVGDIFVHDRETQSTERVSVASDGGEANGHSPNSPYISADGRYVSFSSVASNLVPGDTNGNGDVFVHDREARTTERISVASDGNQADAGSSGGSPSADGRYISFLSSASNLVPGDTNGRFDIFVHDRETGSTERVSVATDGTEGNGLSFGPSISADGNHVVFESAATNLVPSDTNSRTEVFVRDLKAETTERLSVGIDGTEGNERSWSPSLSADGRLVIFRSGASNFIADDTNEEWDLFVHDRETGITERVSVASDGSQANAASGFLNPAISANGRYLAFDSSATNLVPGDTNDASDVFVRDRGPALGVGALSAVPTGETISVSGWATFSGQVLGSADDPSDDGVSGAKEAGAELTGASLTYRAEVEDLLVRLQLASLGSDDERCTVDDPVEVCEQGGGAPGVLAPGLLHGRTFYGMGFELDGIGYEIRARAGSALRVEGERLSDLQHFALYRCDPDCTEQVPLGGGIGTTGSEVRVAVPLAELGASEGASLTRVRAFTAKEEDALEPGGTFDEVDLPDAPISVSHVDLGIASASVPEEEVVYTTEADLVEGSFSGSLDISSLSPGDYRLWARTCLGDLCRARSSSFTTAGDLIETLLDLELASGGNEVVATAELTESGTGAPISGADVSFFVNDEHVGEVVTDQQGRAEITLRRNEFKGRDVLRAVFAGDDRYAPSSVERSARE